MRRGQLVAHALDQPAVVDAFDLHLVVLPAPPLELPLDVPLVPRQVPEPHRVGVDVVQRGQRVGHVVPDRTPGGDVERRLRLGRAAQDVALDELHHVEGALVDRLVGAEAHGDGDRDAGGAERVDQAVLARHVVRRGQHVVQRRAAQGPGLSSRVLDPEGEVGPAACDEGERQRGDDLGELGDHPLRDVALVDPVRCLRHGIRR